MAGDAVHIENLHIEIENVFVAPGTAPETTFTEILDFLREQHDARAFTILGEDGCPVPEEAAESDDDAPTPEEQEEAERVRAEESAEDCARRPDIAGRAKELHEVAKHVAKARNLEGQQNSYRHSASKNEQLKKRYDNAVEAAGLALENACALCEFNNDCELKGDPESWINVHPYKEGRKRRPDSGSDVPMVESRTVFLRVLDAGVEAEEQVHCDPAKRA